LKGEAQPQASRANTAGQLKGEAQPQASRADTAGVRAAMIAWGQLQWPEHAPRSIGAVAERVASPLAEELRALSRLSYGPDAAAWDGSELAKALRIIVVLSVERNESDELLPPLLPSTSVRRSA
jgi:hypothetical protein